MNIEGFTIAAIVVALVAALALVLGATLRICRSFCTKVKDCELCGRLKCLS